MLQKLFDYVDEHFEEMVDDLKSACSIRSVAGDVQGLEEMRKYFLSRWEKAGLKTRRFLIPEGNDLLLAEMKGRQEKTILFYNHYDVVEEGAVETWNSPPYTPTVRDGSIYARGISDNKGPVLSRLHAVEAILHVLGELPVNVKFMTEGDEETISPSLLRFQAENPRLFKELCNADLCIWENSWKDAEGRPWIQCGVRGGLEFELRVKTCRSDAHERMGAILPNAAWRLSWALASLKDSQENILIDGFYDDVLPVTQQEIDVLEQFPYEENALRERMEISEFVNSLTGLELKKKVYLAPSMSVCGLESGEMHNGRRLIVPHEAYAVCNINLVVAQHPEDILEKLRRHLDQHGFSDVEVVPLGMFSPIRTRLDTPYKEIIMREAANVYEQPMICEITQLGGGPAYIFQQAWPEMPIIGIGPGNTGSDHHAPNENLNLEDYKKSVKMVIATLMAM